jgi:hypothetical protein
LRRDHFLDFASLRPMASANATRLSVHASTATHSQATAELRVWAALHLYHTRSLSSLGSSTVTSSPLRYNCQRTGRAWRYRILRILPGIRETPPVSIIQQGPVCAISCETLVIEVSWVVRRSCCARQESAWIRESRIQLS